MDSNAQHIPKTPTLFQGASVQDLQEVNEFITHCVHQALIKYTHECQLGDQNLEQAKHFLGMAKDLGQGDTSQGIEAMRDNHKWLKTQRQRSDKISFAFMSIIVTILVSSTLLAVWEGLKTLIRKSTGG